MCGRFVQSSPGEVVRVEFGLDATPALIPSFNVAPTMEVATIRLMPGDRGRSCVRLRWGLVPVWAKDLRIGPKLINARSETADSKPAFRDAFFRRRCLVPADGFYEWKTGPSGQKQPYLIRLGSQRPFGMAGLWERWRDRGGELVESVTILTTAANDLVAELHDRMPVILDDVAQQLWLDPAVSDAAKLKSLLKPFESDLLEAFPVSTRVNKVANDDASLIEPATSEPSQLKLF